MKLFNYAFGVLMLLATAVQADISGISIGTHGGHMTVAHKAAHPRHSNDFHTAVYGLHARYLIQSGNVVSGFEASITDYNGLQVNAGRGKERMQWGAEAMGFMGYDFGKIIPHVVLGVHHEQTEFKGANGFGAGVGVIYEVSDDLSIGARMTYYNLDNPWQAADRYKYVFRLDATYRFALR